MQFICKFTDILRYDVGLNVVWESFKILDEVGIQNILKSNYFMSQLLFFLFYNSTVVRYFSKNIIGLSLPVYLPKLEFKYFESQLFHFKAIDFSDYRNQWLLCTIPKYKLNSLPFYWPNLEFKCLEIQLFPVTGLFGSRQYVWLLFQKYWILQSLGYLPKLELHSFLYQNSSKIFIITTFVVNNFRNQNHME